MYRLILILISLFITQLVVAQNNYKLSNFAIKDKATILGQETSSQGLDVQFIFSPKVLDHAVHEFTMEFKYKEYVVAKQSKNFTYTCSDSIAYLVDSLGIDSIENLDTLVHLYLPYRAIELEEGTHEVQVSIFVKGKALAVYNKVYSLNQVKIYDLALDLEKATIEGADKVNPIGLNQYMPDPKWYVKIGTDELLQGLVSRNEFELTAKSFSTAISNFDTVEICIYDSDPTIMAPLGCYKVNHGSADFAQQYKGVVMGDKIKNGQFNIKKTERKPVSSKFVITENYDYKSIKGIKVDFNYGLPIHYKRRSIDIKIVNEQLAVIDNIINLSGDRTQEEHRIVGRYSYFIPYYNLQQSKRIQLTLTGNNNAIVAHQTKDLVIEKTIDGLNLTQTVGHVYKGISGILYQLDFTIPQFPKEGMLKLNFPTLSAETIGHLIYWYGNNPNLVYKGSKQDLLNENQQQIFIFLPYFTAPKTIKIKPTLTIETIDVPPINLTTFETKEYACPTSLNDIHVVAKLNEERIFTGLAGQYFEFEIDIPEYYHSKGFFELKILENGQVMETGFFINNDANQPKKQAIHNQKNISVFIPYRFMKNGAKYEVSLQAKDERFALSENRISNFVKSGFPLLTIGFYLQQVTSKEWDKIVYKVGIRNDKNPNSTYEHLGYETVLQDTLSGNYKADIPKSGTFTVAHKDEIIIWIKGANMRDDQAIRLKTSIQELEQAGNMLQLKNQGALKTATFKMIPKN